jgi:hypothetical protein
MVVQCSSSYNNNAYVIKLFVLPLYGQEVNVVRLEVPVPDAHFKLLNPQYIFNKIMAIDVEGV